MRFRKFECDSDLNFELHLTISIAGNNVFYDYNYMTK